LEERHDALRLSVLRVYVDALSGRLVGVTPRPPFWSVFEEARSRNPQVLLLKPDEVKQRLANSKPLGVVWWRRGSARLAAPILIFVSTNDRRLRSSSWIHQRWDLRCNRENLLKRATPFSEPGAT